MCNDIKVKNGLPLRSGRRNEALDMTPCSTHLSSPSFFHVVLLAVPGVMEVNRSNLDVRMKGILVEQNRTSSMVCHVETICEELVIKVSSCFLQGDDVPLPRNVFFDRSFFSASRSWVPIVDAEPLQFGRSIRYIVVEPVVFVGWRVFSGGCIAVRGIDTSRIDNMTPKNGLRVCLHPSCKTVMTGRDVFLITR